ncbi:hypothetical protein LPJ72_006502, partial [Coemansia sp. Benny D160-2]
NLQPALPALPARPVQSPPHPRNLHLLPAQAIPCTQHLPARYPQQNQLQPQHPRLQL